MILILFHFIAMQIRAELGLLPNWVKQKTGAKNSRERLCNKANTKEGTAWIKLKKIKTDCNSGFGKLVSLTVFQSSRSFYLTFDITLRRHICWRGSCNFSFTSIFFASVTFHIVLGQLFMGLYYYMGNFCSLIGLEQWYFNLIWNTYMWKLQTFGG